MSKRKRKKRSVATNVKRRIRKRHLPDPKPAKASKYLHHLKKYHEQHPDMVAVLLLRVSARSQNHKKNLLNHERVLRRRLKRLGISIEACFYEVGSGWITGHIRDVFREAVHKARQFKGAAIVTTSSDRFLRNRNFTTDEPDLCPTVAEFEKLKKLAGGVPLLTLLRPDIPPRKVRGYQTEWGQRAKGNNGGRPILKRPGYMKVRLEKKLPIVRRLLKKGKNSTEIAKKVRVPRSTVSDWIEKYI